MWRILLVDDDEQQLRTCKNRLELSDAPYEIDISDNIDDAIAKIKNGIYDVIITDLRMPSDDYEGFKVIKTIKQKDPGFTNTKVIVLTVVGAGSPEEGFRALRLALQIGVSDYIIKGWDHYLDMLDMTIQKILQEPKIVGIVRNQVFIVCPYDDHHNQICKYLKKETDKSFNFIRADDQYEGDFLKEIIYKQIASSEYVLVFISGLNSNVMYELGLAHGLGKKVIIIKDVRTEVNSDLSGIQYISYDQNTQFDLIEKIFNALIHFSPNFYDSIQL